MNNQIPSQFTIRVYALITNDQKEVLVTDEFQIDMKMTKFPGGGMHFGEGPIDCLKREMLEECNQEIEDIRHFYTTDFFQASAFNDNVQIMAIYYLVKFKVTPVILKLKEKKFDFPSNEHAEQIFRWIPLNKLNVEEFELPIDRVVVKMIKGQIL